MVWIKKKGVVDSSILRQLVPFPLQRPVSLSYEFRVYSEKGLEDQKEKLSSSEIDSLMMMSVALE